MTKAIRRIRSCIVLCLAGLLAAGALPRQIAPVTAAEQPDTFRVGICYDISRPYDSCVIMGFKDALCDAYGKDRVIFAEQNVSETATPATAAETLLQTKSQLLFTYGNQSLEAAASLTDSVPIIFGGVANYFDQLHLLPGQNKNTTGRNVSGISAVSPVAEQLSLVIEVADHAPQAVGILYDPTDTNAIFQNDIMERYLTEAGIPWKEFEIREQTLPLDPTEATAGDTASALLAAFPGIQAAASGKEGPNIHPDSIGESGDLTGINEPMSARSAQVSPLWSGAPITDAPPSETLSMAFGECDVIYLCSGNKLLEDPQIMEQFDKLSIETQTATVGGNNTNEPQPGHTLACLYEDPYDLGYRCGRMSISVLNGDRDISQTPILSPAADKTTKLYNARLSDALKKTWPKSFHEDAEYFESYIPGSLTERVTEE